MEYGVKFFDKMVKSDKFFFFYYGICGCYFDNYLNVKYVGSFLVCIFYGDCMVEMNDIFVNLYKVLEKNGQFDNMLIVFIFDNGLEVEVLLYGCMLFCGVKGFIWEGGVCVLIFVYWKGMI